MDRSDKHYVTLPDPGWKYRERAETARGGSVLRLWRIRRLNASLYRVTESSGEAAFTLGTESHEKKYILQTNFTGFQQIPRDKNYNVIADSWNKDYYAININTGKLDPKQFRNFGNIEDEDTSPGTNYTGDHITAYEEYRGFMVWEHAPVIGRSSPVVKHTDTSPDTKDMFVVNDGSETKYQGIGKAVSHISQHLVPSTHVRANGQVTFNNHGWVYAVRVVSDSAYATGDDAKYGETTLGPPHAGHTATIYTTQIRLDEGAADENSVISGVIGHELGHAAHLDHCPVDG